ncbi:uncharacterized protein [Miscanthus floridulus]|uniref:uncharacterized protein n=1 Tax=Miscanthus floridulus TaxID=154761 RepID=UPI00345875E8
MAQTIQNNQNNHPQQVLQVRDKRGEFLKGRPPTFNHSPDRLQADDWLRAVERQLEIAQCDDREKVLYASGQLQGAALDWWDSFQNGYPNTNQITWQVFRENFRSHHVPAGLMRLKRKEFLALKQGGMSVSEYRDKFTQLSRYAPNDVEADQDKQELFMEGLNDGLQYQLLSQSFANYQQLVDKALVIESKRRDMEAKKRKFQNQQLGSNSRPRFS